MQVARKPPLPASSGACKQRRIASSGAFKQQYILSLPRGGPIAVQVPLCIAYSAK